MAPSSDTVTVSARVTRVERGLLDAAAARAGYRKLSPWLQDTIRERLADEFGDQAIESVQDDPSPAAG